MKSKPKLAFFLIVLFQVLVLAVMIIGNEAALANGQAVVLQTAPVDPYDIFRGEYVQLRYEISTLEDIPGIEKLRQGGDAFVRLEQNGGIWDAVAVTDKREDTKDWPLFITGEVTYVFNERSGLITGNRATVDYGIEQYFVPEGEGQAIQNVRDLQVRVKITSSGKPFIENLIVNGEVVR